MDSYIPRDRYAAVLVGGLGLLAAIVVTTACDDNNLELQITNSEAVADLQIDASGPSFSFNATLPVEDPRTLFRSVGAQAGDVVTFVATVSGTTVASASCTVAESAFEAGGGTNTASVLVVVSDGLIICAAGWVTTF